MSGKGGYRDQQVEVPSRNTPELQLLYQALGEEIGLIVETDNVALAIQRLQRAKRESKDPALEVIQIRHSPEPDYKTTDIWITRKAPQEEQSDGLD